jgi:alcohol dehydrogenase
LHLQIEFTFPEVLAAYGDCVFSRLAELARLVGVGAADDNDKILANKFVAAIVEMRSTMDMPLQIENFTPQKQDDVVRSAGAEAGNMYPVPRYLDESDLQSIVNGLVAV